MNRGGIGAASIMLVFVVLCLVIFAIISLSPALTERALARQELALVQDFYAADARAERIVAEILTAPTIPAAVDNIPIGSFWSMEVFADVAYFAVPINETMLLNVEIALGAGGLYQILTWRMQNTHDWQPDDSIDLFDPDDETFFQGW